MRQAVLSTSVASVKKVATGKDRDIYEVGDRLLIVATDRISAFDVVMPNGIPDKGRVLTGMTLFWLEHFADEAPNHLITADLDAFPEEIRNDPTAEDLRGRSMLVKKAEVFPVECVARGYLAGSGWKEYQSDSSVCGHALPPGLRLADKLPEPIFTPSTKAASGHDQNITRRQAADIVGEEAAERLEELTLGLYAAGSDYAAERGILIADTKFEFGVVDGEITLVDEVLTPDSSRFWPADTWTPGQSPPSFDKQFVRDYLETLDWNKEPPGPKLPDDVVEKTRLKYVKALKRLSGRDLP